MVDNNILAALVVVAIVVSLGTVAVTYNTLSSITTVGAGTALGQTFLDLQTSTDISLPTNTVLFGTVNVGETHDTTDDVPLPFTVQNDGSVNVDVEIKATDLWTAEVNPTPYYQAMCGNSLETVCPIGSVMLFSNIPENDALIGLQVIKNMDFADANDLLEVEIRIEVPPSEGAGTKSSDVTFTATQAL
ncbi:MAG: hypothetical protein ABIF08_02750 [Nanoarchaeota archaeon]